jgi:hypothetical protein
MADAIARAYCYLVIGAGLGLSIVTLAFAIYRTL